MSFVRQARGGRGSSYEKAKNVAMGFHGRESRGELEVESQYRYQKNLANLGFMMDLEVLDPNDDKYVQPIPFPSNQFVLGCSPDQKQLYIVAAKKGKRFDLNVRKMEWVSEGEASKPRVILGECAAISYYTDKHHLEGPKYQKDGAPYRHEFGTEGSNPEDNMLPLVVYDRMNGVIELIGGSYEVTELGIKG